MTEADKNAFQRMMGKIYGWICVADFIVFPIMYTLVQFAETEAANDAFRQWSPLTLVNGGLIHLSFAAILGISSFVGKKDGDKVA
jgi:hypothetical protein